MSKAGAALLLAMLCTGCRRDMFDQPKYLPLQESRFFTDGRSARPVPPGTYAYDENFAGAAVENGTRDGDFVATIPVPIDEARLVRGKDRFNVYCAPCHGRLGDGHGMVAKRGFMQPADLDSERVRKAPPGYLYAVIANGYGAMTDYADAIGVQDRWAIVAYIRALELSRHATLADVPPEARPALEEQR